MQEPQNAIHQDIVIVGAGIAGLTTALGLHRLGVKCLVLEYADSLRVTGFALTIWTNAWRALDALGIGDSLRQKSHRLQGFEVASPDSGSSNSLTADVNWGKSESRCVKRRDLLETLENELPKGTIRYSSKVVSIEESNDLKLVYLSDGSIIKAKVLIGCDGVNSFVAKWLGLQNPVSAGRSAIRGFVDYPDGHGFEPKFHAYFGGGVRFGFIPCDDKSVYWFCTFTPLIFNYDEDEKDPLKMKQFVLSNIKTAPKRVSDVVANTQLQFISVAPLKFRHPWNILLGNIVKNNICVAGDALHPMTPDIGQGGCSALEDGVVLARCLAEALLAKTENGKDDDYVKMEKGLLKYTKERKWRCFSLISMAYTVGWIQESNGKVMSFLRRRFLARLTIDTVLRMADFDCGKLIMSSI